MTLTQILEEDKRELLEALESAREPEKMVPVLEKEIDRILYRHNEECDNENLRNAAAWILQTVKAAAAFVESESEVKIWEQTRADGQTGKKHSPWGYILSAAGLVLVIAALAAQSGVAGLIKLPVSLAFGLLGAAALFLGGYLSAGKSGFKKAGSGHADESRYKTEILPGSERIYRVLHTAMLVADQNLQQAAVLPGGSGTEIGADSADGQSGDLLKLFSDLLEAEYSGDGEFALERLGRIRYFLHRHGIETVDYGEPVKSLFDTLPSDAEGTLRPALVREEKLLVRGLAASGGPHVGE